MSLDSTLERLEAFRGPIIAKVREHAAAVVAVAFSAWVVSAMLTRLRIGVDFTDEAFTTSLAYRFAQGDRPFIDEINSAQTASLILTPFIWLFLKVKHSTTGIIWFVRVLFMTFRVATGAAMFSAIRRNMSWPLALVSSLLAVVFVPHSIPNLGYNALGSGFLLLAGVLAARGLAGPPLRGALFWAGICGGLASLAYPPLAIAIVLLGVVFLVASRGKLGDFLLYVAGGSLVAACVVPFVVRAGSANLEVMIELGTKFAPKLPSRWLDMVLAFFAHSPVNLAMFPCFILLGLALKMRPVWSVWIFPVFACALALAPAAGYTSQMPIMIYGCLLAPFFLAFVWDDAVCRALFAAVWIPSFIGGLVTAYTSSNGEHNGGIGFFPGATLFLVYEAFAVEKLLREAGSKSETGPLESLAGLRVLNLLGPCVLVWSLLARYQYSAYRETALTDLVVRIQSGPFKGLLTTAEHASLSDELVDIFRRHRSTNGKLFAYWDAPSAYLFTPMRAAGNTVWVTPMADQDALLSYYQGRVNGAGLVLRIRGSGKGRVPVDDFIETRGRLLESTARCDVFAEPTP